MDIVKIIVNAVAILFAPIVAVLIGQYLQNKQVKRKDKIDIFKTLVAENVYGWGDSYRAVNALNAIPIIFADNENVLERYKTYYDLCSIKDAQLSVIDVVEQWKKMPSPLGNISPQNPKEQPNA